mmetsp:Transcript_16068/g.41250  ORF Transcript_16068/g.41250 Transcript_16068/m.41250 type:complete len:443 (+) Transcript_16068:91-1419(+)
MADACTHAIFLAHPHVELLSVAFANLHLARVALITPGSDGQVARPAVAAAHAAIHMERAVLVDAPVWATNFTVALRSCAVVSAGPTPLSAEASAGAASPLKDLDGAVPGNPTNRPPEQVPASHPDTPAARPSLPAAPPGGSASAGSTDPPSVTARSHNGAPAGLGPRAAAPPRQPSRTGACDGGITVSGWCIIPHAAVKLVRGDLALSGCLFANFAIGGTQRPEQQRAAPPAPRPDGGSMPHQDAIGLEHPPMKTVTSQSVVEAAYAGSFVLEDSQFVHNTFNNCYISLVATHRHSPIGGAPASATVHTLVAAENTLGKTCPAGYCLFLSGIVMGLTASNVSLTGVRMSGLRVTGPSVTGLGVLCPVAPDSSTRVSGLWATNCYMHAARFVFVDSFKTSTISNVHMADNMVRGVVFFVESAATVIADAVFSNNTPTEIVVGT